MKLLPRSFPLLLLIPYGSHLEEPFFCEENFTKEGSSNNYWQG